MPAGIEVRWGMLEDEEKVADLLQLNGMPRWVAFEERFVVAERDGEILAALRYRTEPKRLLLGLLVSDPWAEERSLAVALYAGRREAGAGDGRRRGHRASFPHADYPARGRVPQAGPPGVAAGRDAGRRGARWVGSGGWRRLFRLFGVTGVPFFRAFSPRR